MPMYSNCLSTNVSLLLKYVLKTDSSAAMAIAAIVKSIRMGRRSMLGKQTNSSVR